MQSKKKNMEQTTVNKVAELYKRKFDLLGELEQLINVEDYEFYIGKCLTGLQPKTIFGYEFVSSSFLAEIKKLTEAHIKQQIEEIDKELEEL